MDLKAKKKKGGSSKKSTRSIARTTNDNQSWKNKVLLGTKERKMTLLVLVAVRKKNVIKYDQVCMYVATLDIIYPLLYIV